MPPTIAIILVSWNTRDLLRQALLSIRAHAALPVSVYVVDNASSDDSVAMVRAEFPEANVIVNADNRGFGQANNQGFAAGEEPFILLLNSDAELTQGALPTLVDELQRHPEAGAVGARLVFPDGSFQSSCFPFPTLRGYALELAGLAHAVFGSHYPSRPESLSEQSCKADWISGACMLLRRRSLGAVVGFDPAFHMYAEELELCRRLWDAGWSVRYCADAVALHHVGRSSDQRRLEQPSLLWESRLTYCRRHRPEWECRILFALIVLGYSLRGAIWSARSLWGNSAERSTWRLKARSAWHVLDSIHA